jgi:hypothetical protein
MDGLSGNFGAPQVKFADPRDIGCGPSVLIDARRLRPDSVVGAEPDSWLERVAGVFVPPASPAVPGMHLMQRPVRLNRTGTSKAGSGRDESSR